MFRLCLVLALLLTSSFIHATENRTALVIGNSNYHSAALINPKNDAEDFAKALKKLGFNVILRVDANLREMDEAVTEFGKILEKNTGVGLFFYAGHGVQSNGRNYLIPIDSDLNRESDLKYNAMDAGKVLDEMGYAKNGLNIAILDACRDNPLSRSFRGGKKGLARPNDVPTGILIAYSTAPGQQASDGAGRNSPYTKALLHSIQEKGQPLELVFKNVIKSVKQETHGKQIPWVSSSVDGDFYFAGKESEPITVKLVSARSTNSSAISAQDIAISTSDEFELLYWKSVINNPNSGKYRAYLVKYPNGHFKAIAQTELTTLNNSDNKISSNGNISENIINSTIDKCDAYIASYYLTSGPEGNAFDCYNLILKDSPDNADALAGIVRIEEAYIKLSEKYLKQKNIKKAQQRMSKLEQINPSNTALPRLKEKYLLLSQSIKSQATQATNNIVAKTTKESTDNGHLSKEQQQIYNEYKEVIEDLLIDQQYKKAELYLQKLIKINPQAIDINHYKQILNQHGAKFVVLSKEKQQIFDEYRDVIEELLKEKTLSDKAAKKVETYLAKLKELNFSSGEINRLTSLYKNKLN